MKIRILDRILVALAGLLMLAGAAALAAQLFFGKNVAGKAAQLLSDPGLRVYLIIGGVLICALGIYCLLLLFRHKGKNGKFIMQRTESGELAISLKALESMVMKCLEQHKELNAQSVHLENQKGSLVVRIRGNVAGGISIPLTVDTLQQQIRQYVTACSGVEVKDIRVEIEASGPEAKDAPFAIEAPAAKALLKAAGENGAAPQEAETAETPKAAAAEPAAETEPAAPAKEAPRIEDELAAAAAAAALVKDQTPEEEDDRPIHQRLFSNVEEPCVMPMPPVKREEESKPEEAKPAENAGPGGETVVTAKGTAETAEPAAEGNTEPAAATEEKAEAADTAAEGTAEAAVTVTEEKTEPAGSAAEGTADAAKTATGENAEAKAEEGAAD